MHAGIMDVGGIFLVDRHRMRAENLALHHLGEAEDGVQRRAQLVAHLREEAGFGDVGGFGAVACFVRDRLGLFQLADQGVFLGACFQGSESGGVQAMRQQHEIALGGERERGQDVVVQRAGHRKAQRHGDGDRRGGGKRCDREIGGEHARYCDHQQHQEHHQRFRDHVEHGMDQDRHPAQPIEQIEHDEACPPCARCRRRGGFGQEAPATADHRTVQAEHARGPGSGWDRLHPQPEQHARCDHQQHHDIRGRQPRLGILAQHFGVEGRTGSAGRR